MLKYFLLGYFYYANFTCVNGSILDLVYSLFESVPLHTAP